MLRLTVLPPAAEFLIAPMLGRFLAAYPDIRIEILAEPALVDIVSERFDAGIRVGERLERDMVALRVGEDLRLKVVASPDYLARAGTPQRPQDLRAHNCIRFRFPGQILPWRFEKKGKRIEVAVEGSAIINDPYLGTRLAADGGGIFYMLDSYAAPLIAEGRLVSLLEDWLPPPESYYLYYPTRRQNPAALQVLIDFFKSETKTGRSKASARRQTPV
jgi:DNA-binding transcriptional LysR family regulator